MKMKKRAHKKLWIVAAALIVVSIACAVTYSILASHQTTAPKAQKKSVSKKTQKPSPVQAPQPAVPAFNKMQYSVTDPASLWVIVNKQHPLTPTSYAPADITSSNGTSMSARVAPSLAQMFQDAKSGGITLIAQSGYRSYSYQQGLYSSYVAKDGQAEADTYSARPGHSEHQTGLAVDVGGVTQPSCNLEQCFSETAEGRWLAENAYKYGFIIRYTPQNQAVSGYSAEPWHLRFVGVELVSELKKQNITTLEEFFGISGGANY